MESQTSTQSHAHDQHAEEHFGHAAPLSMLWGTWGALIVLTFITVAATWVDFGFFNTPLAMIIATVKALLVAAFFMHLVYDRPLNSIIFVCSLVFVALFVSMALLDTVTYQPTMIPNYMPGIER